jgi:hypothetical protein
MHSLGVDLTLCQWMAIVALSLIPLTWLGTPKDFWYVINGLTNSVKKIMDHIFIVFFRNKRVLVS